MNPDWSRRDLLKSAATGVLGASVGAAVLARSNRYVVGAREPGAVAAAASVSDVDHGRIDLGEHTSLTLVTGVYSTARRRSLGGREDVAFVQRDRTLSPVGADTADTLPWGIDRVDADVAHEAGATGEGVDVAVLDTGIDPTHPDLEGALADPGVEDNHEAWVDCRGDCEHDWADDGGHGTHVAGTVGADGEVVGVAPGVRLHALKVCGGGGCRTSHVARAIRYAADRDWTVINLSLGSPDPSPALRAAGRYALRAGSLPVAAAGNRGEPGTVGYPAAYEEFLAVSATDLDDDVAGFSSTGPEVDLAAPGAGVCSTTVGGHEVFDGTSMASPHVAGAAAQAIADGYSPREARERLVETAEDLGHDPDRQGAGLVDVAAAVGEDSGDDGTGDGTDCRP